MPCCKYDIYVIRTFPRTHERGVGQGVRVSLILFRRGPVRASMAFVQIVSQVSHLLHCVDLLNGPFAHDVEVTSNLQERTTFWIEVEFCDKQFTRNSCPEKPASGRSNHPNSTPCTKLLAVLLERISKLTEDVWKSRISK